MFARSLSAAANNAFYKTLTAKFAFYSPTLSPFRYV